MYKKYCVYSHCAVAALLAVPGISVGESLQLEEIVVTAQKRETSLQDTPLTVVAVSGEEVASTPTSDIESALADVPGIQFISQQNYGLVVSARGVGPGVTDGQGGVSTMYDGVYSNNPLSARTGFYDVNRFEVLLGPQGTLYGRNAEGGVIHVITNDPTHEFEGFTSFGIGNYGLINVQGMLNVPFSDKASLRLAGVRNKRDGYLSSGHEDNDSTSVRAKFLYEPTDMVSILLGGEKTIINEIGQSSVAPQENHSNASRDVPFSDAAYNRQEGYKVWANIGIDVGIADLTVIPSYQKTDEVEQETNNIYPGEDGIYTTADDTDIFSNINLGLGSLDEESLEIRLNSKSDSPVTWVVGYYQYEQEDLSPYSEFNGDGDIVYSNGTIYLAEDALSNYVLNTQDSVGLFGQLDVPVTDQLTLSLGIRYSEDEATIFNDGNAEPSVAADASVEYDHEDYRIGIQYQFDNDMMAYASYSTGYRPGAFSPAPPRPSYDIEEINAYEIGLKADLLDGSLRLNTSMYYYDYTGYQQTTFVPCWTDITGPIEGLDMCTGPIPINLVIRNADTIVQGVDISGQYIPTGNDVISFSVALADSEIDESLVVGLGPSATDIEGSQLANHPEVAVNLSYAHNFNFNSGVLTPQLTANYVSEIILTYPKNDINTQDAVTRYDFQLGYEPVDGDWSVNLWARNLTDEVVAASSAGATHTLAPPRTFGFTVTSGF